MSFAMSAADREQFLAGLHVGVLSVAVNGAGEAAGSRAPLAVPVWYDYQPGGQVSVITSRSSRKGRAIRAAGRMSLCAQDERPPYRYVSVEGPVEITELDPADRLAMARRYLGPEGGDRYVAGNPDPAGENMMVRMAPEHWLSVDYGQRPG
ncbi:MAG TPA: pyridoxamine 5'-phosphate oxidase family protein [Streptosporangiaceae bacterium]|nr:pyridoxamine 5'-phosphate oxidase family protein [Streptosporangiaceae bacterium]